MLTLTAKKMNERGFIGAMLTLNSDPKLDRATAYRVGRIVDVGQRELAKIHEVELEMRTELAEKDEKGEIVMIDMGHEGKRAKVAEDKLGEYEKRIEKLLEKEIYIRVHKLDFNMLQGLTGAQLVAIEDILDNVPNE